MELPVQDHRPTAPERLRCSCGKPLDRFGVVPGQPSAPGQLMRHPSVRRHGRADAPGRLRIEGARLRYRCRKCRRPTVLRDATIRAAYERAAARGQRDVTVGIDV